MPSSYSSNLRFELQATGENRTTWGLKTNNNLELIEDALTGFSVIGMADANVTLTTANGATDQSRNLMLVFTGNNSAVRTVTIPVVSKSYLIKNSVSNGHAITISTGGPNTATIPNGAWMWIWTDGSTVFSSTALTSDYALKTDVDDLSGVTNAAGARTNLGLVIGTNVQAYDSTLTAFAGYNTNGLLTQTAADTFTGRTLTGTANEITVTNGDGVAGAPTFSLPAALTFTGKVMTGGTYSGSFSGTWTSGAITTSSATITGGSVTGITDITVADGGTGASTAANARTNLGLVIGTDIQAFDANTLKSNVDRGLTAGYTSTAVNDGTLTTGTYTPTPAGGNLKRAVNGGSFTIAAPVASGDYTIIVQLSNNASAGTVSFTGFNAQTGVVMAATNGLFYNLYITKLNGRVTLNITAS